MTANVITDLSHNFCDHTLTTTFTRSKIARGRCGQPIAGCMRPLQWDPELARVAQKWADQCVEVDYRGDKQRKDPYLFHDKHGLRKTGKSYYLPTK